MKASLEVSFGIVIGGLMKKLAPISAMNDRML
jgi:hypothetical protein